MIIPAAVFRVSSFYENGKFQDKVGDSGMALVVFDNGAQGIVKFVSNLKETTAKTIQDYFDFKRDKFITSKDITAVVAELDYYEPFDELWLKKEVEINAESKKELLMAKKSFKEVYAKKFLQKKREIGVGTVFRAPLSTTKQSVTIKGKRFPVLISRSIIYQDDTPSISGLYIYSNARNQIPVTLHPVFTKDGIFGGFFSVKLSKVSTKDHFDYLSKHIVRSQERQIADEKKYFPRFFSKNPLLKRLSVTLNEAAKQQDVEKYNQTILEINQAIQQYPRLIMDLELGFNLTCSTSHFLGLLRDKNPMSQLPETLTMLNFGKENPDIKKRIKASVKEEIYNFANGKTDPNLFVNAVYNTPAVKLTEEESSWGFMAANIIPGSLVYNATGTKKIIKKLSEKILAPA